MYEPTIGLEVHAQLATASKLFCACRVADGAPPNTDVCPVCLGHPGTLPVINAGAVRLAVRAAVALGCTVHDRSIFARKQYFYPDLPKGYQISQFEEPLATGGAVHARVGDQERAFRLTRIHMEEDAGKSVHGPDGTGVDFNRAGTPLIEIVSEPELRSPDDAEAYLRMLHRVLTRAGVTGGDLEKGHFRCDANVSLHEPGAPLGTRVEIKNLNSFRFVAKAIAYEIERQSAVLQAGGAVVQETRMWRGGETASMRLKESSSDYRYFPEPDLPPMPAGTDLVDAAVADLPGAPLDRWLLAADARERVTFQERTGLDDYATGVLLANDALRAVFNAAVAAGGAADAMAKWAMGPVAQRLNEADPHRGFAGTALARLEALIDAGTLSRGMARDVLDALWESGGDPDAVVEARGLAQVSDTAALQAVIDAAIADHPDHARRFREGNQGMIGFFMGRVMRATRGRADPALARRLVVESLQRL